MTTTQDIENLYDEAAVRLPPGSTLKIEYGRDDWMPFRPWVAFAKIGEHIGYVRSGAAGDAINGAIEQAEARASEAERAWAAIIGEVA